MNTTNSQQEMLNKMLIGAAKMGDAELIENCIQLGADSFAHDKDDKTALEYTIAGKHFEATKKLVELGALKKGDEELRKEKEKIYKEINKPYDHNFLSINNPQYEENVKLFNSISRYFCNTYYSTKLLEQSIDNNDIETTKLLLNSGANVTIVAGNYCLYGDKFYDFGTTEKNLLNNSVKNGNIEMVDTVLPFFMEQRSDSEQKWNIKEAKETAVIYNQRQIFDKLDQINIYTSEFDKKYAEREKTEELDSYLKLAVENNHSEMVDSILQKYPERYRVNAGVLDKCIKLAVADNNTDLTANILQKYPENHDIKIQSKEIYQASINGNVDMLDLLLAHNEDKHHWFQEFYNLDEHTYTMQTKSACAEAARLGHTKVVEKLFDHGVDADDRYCYETIKYTIDSKGNETSEDLLKVKAIPLFLAAENGHVETVKFLLNRGVPLDSRNYDGEDIYDVTTKAKQFEIQKLIKQEEKRRQIEERKKQDKEKTALKISQLKDKLKDKTQDPLELKEAGNVELNKAVMAETKISQIDPVILKILQRKNNKTQ